MFYPTLDVARMQNCLVFMRSDPQFDLFNTSQLINGASHDIQYQSDGNDLRIRRWIEILVMVCYFISG